jgi:hypothetical protein
MKRPLVIISGILLTSIMLFAALPAFAASQATGVAVSAGSNCDGADMDLSMVTDATVNREGGIVTNAAGQVLNSFEQPTITLVNFSGTFFNYGMSNWSASQPPGTIIGLYAWVGSQPYSAANSIEWFIAYVCNTGEVVYSCFGPYGNCPQSVTQIPSSTGPAAQNCPNPRPSNYVVRGVPAGALAYFEPRSDAYTGFNLPPGTWYVGPVDANGFVGVWIACRARIIYIPAANVAG